MSDDLEEQMLKGVSAGNTDALEWLYKDYYRYVISRLRRFGMPEDTVEELAHEVFYRFCAAVREGGPRFESKAGLMAYLKKCAFHVSLDYKDKNKRALVSVDDPDNSIQALEVRSRDNPELRAAVSEILGMLSPADRESILMIDVEGLSHAEAAERRDVTPATSKNQLLAARRRFRELYRRRQDD
ncbi:MAG: RNA polymerase sigma factor [Pyrinomonadaceae bacterium]